MKRTFCVFFSLFLFFFAFFALGIKETKAATRDCTNLSRGDWCYDNYGENFCCSATKGNNNVCNYRMFAVCDNYGNCGTPSPYDASYIYHDQCLLGNQCKADCVAQVDSASFSCSGTTLSASWSGNSRTDCNIYYYEGSTSHQISTNCDGSGTATGVAGGTYHLYASPNSSGGTIDGGEVTCPPASCTYNTWTNDLCGGGTCAADKMHQTRTVATGTGCTDTSRCVDDPTCASNPSASLSSGCSGATPYLNSSWSNIGSGTNNIYVQAGNCAYPIGTSNTGSSNSLTSLSGGTGANCTSSTTTITNGTIYHLYARDSGGTIKAQSGDVTPNCSSGGGGGGSSCTVSWNLSNSNPAPNTSINVTVTGNSSSVGWGYPDLKLDGNDSGNLTSINANTPSWYYTGINSGAAGTHTLSFLLNVHTGYTSTTCTPNQSFTTIAPPNPPTFLTASCPAPGTAATLSWTGSSGATYYNAAVYDGSDPANNYNQTLFNNIASTSYTFTSSTGRTNIQGDSYNWWVQACNSAGCSAATWTSNYLVCPPAAPTGTLTLSTNPATNPVTCYIAYDTDNNTYGTACGASANYSFNNSPTGATLCDQDNTALSWVGGPSGSAGYWVTTTPPMSSNAVGIKTSTFTLKTGSNSCSGATLTDSAGNPATQTLTSIPYVRIGGTVMNSKWPNIIVPGVSVQVCDKSSNCPTVNTNQNGYFHKDDLILFGTDTSGYTDNYYGYVGVYSNNPANYAIWSDSHLSYSSYWNYTWTRTTPGYPDAIGYVNQHANQQTDGTGLPVRIDSSGNTVYDCRAGAYQCSLLIDPNKVAISGYVKDPVTNAGIRGITVSVRDLVPANPAHTTTTDTDGHYSFPDSIYFGTRYYDLKVAGGEDTAGYQAGFARTATAYPNCQNNLSGTNIGLTTVYPGQSQYDCQQTGVDVNGVVNGTGLRDCGTAGNCNFTLYPQPCRASDGSPSLGSCGDSIPAANTIGTCSAGSWTANHGPNLAYDHWCKLNANSTRSFCYTCSPSTSAWIQATGDVHSNERINASGGP